MYSARQLSLYLCLDYAVRKDYVGPFASADESDDWLAEHIEELNPVVQDITLVEEIAADHGTLVIPPHQWPFKGFHDDDSD